MSNCDKAAGKQEAQEAVMLPAVDGSICNTADFLLPSVRCTTEKVGHSQQCTQWRDCESVTETTLR